MGCSPWGRYESDTTERLHFHFSLSCIGEGNGNPLQCSCLENPRDRASWWAALWGRTESDTTEVTQQQQQQRRKHLLPFVVEEQYTLHALGQGRSMVSVVPHTDFQSVPRFWPTALLVLSLIPDSSNSRAFPGFFVHVSLLLVSRYPFTSRHLVLAPSTPLNNLPHFINSPCTEICVLFCFLLYFFCFVLKIYFFFYSFTVILVTFLKEVEKHSLFSMSCLISLLSVFFNVILKCF